MKNICPFLKGCLFAWAIGFSLAAHAQISITYPVTRTVIQRDNSNQAKVYVTGRMTQVVDRVEARLNARSGEGGTTVGWQTIASNATDATYHGFLTATGGRYDLEVRGIKNNTQVGVISKVEKVGVGEVFLIVGHSNTAGGDAYSKTIDYAYGDAYKDRVNAIDVKTNPNDELYWNTADPKYAAPYAPVQLCQDCGIGPAVTMRWLWGRFGELVVKNLNVPVLLYSAAFGGTNIEMTYKAAYDIPFDHSFVKYAQRHPYTHIRTTIKTYAPSSGLRAILCGHGVNDRENQGIDFENQLKDVIRKTREETEFAKLAWLVAQTCWINGECQGEYTKGSGITNHITKAQLNVIASVSDVFRGANLNEVGNEGRNDDHVHLNQVGQAGYAEKWANVINTEFLQKSTPLLAKAPEALPALPAVTSVKTGSWSDPTTWSCNCIPNYSTNVTIQKAHEVTIKGVFSAKILKNEGKLTYASN